ncbi:hypothetical protein ACHAXT_003786 [Thalassiosira profunda]
MRRRAYLRLSAMARFAVTLVISAATAMFFAAHLQANTATIGSHNHDSSTSGAWDATDLPIQKSIDDGFHPIYVYSRTNLPGFAGKYSQSSQDSLIVKLLEVYHAKTKNFTGTPFFVDLAANHPLVHSNTYSLERRGWNGVCLEPNPIYWYGLASHRTCVIIGAFVGGPEEEDGKEVGVVLSRGVTGGIVADGLDNAGRQSEEKRNLVSMATVFRQANVPSVIDYFSLDVEGAEYLVMKDFPWHDYTFSFITIERANKKLRALLASKGYVLTRIISDFGESLWIHNTIQLSENEINDVCKGLDIPSYSAEPSQWKLPRLSQYDDG